MKKTVLLFVIFLAPFSHANTDWFEGGNGGTVMNCANKLPRTMDLYEAVNRYGLTIDQSHATSLDERVNFILAKISSVNPERASLYSLWFLNFSQESEFIDGESLGPIPDLGYIKIPDGCKPEQVVFQRQPSRFNSFRYTISRKWWDQLTIVDQAAMLLHEFIYREMALPPNLHTTSEFSRHLNGWMNSTDFQNTNAKSYLRMLQEVNVVNAEFAGYKILLNSKDFNLRLWVRLPLTFEANGAATVTLAQGQTIDMPNNFINSVCNRDLDSISTIGVLSFSESGLPLKLIPLKNQPNITNCHNFLFSKTIPDLKVFGDIWNFDSQGNIQKITGAYKTEARVYAPVKSKDRAINIVNTQMPVQMTTYLDSSGDIKTVAYNGEACRRDNQNLVISATDTTASAMSSLRFGPTDNEIMNLPFCNTDR